MAYIITTTNPRELEARFGPAADDTETVARANQHRTTRAVTTLADAIDAVQGIQDRDGDATEVIDDLSPEGGTIIMPDGTKIEVEFWGAARAVNWMVEHGYDPAVEFFIDTYNTDDTNRRSS